MSREQPEEHLVSRIETVPELSGRCYPNIQTAEAANNGSSEMRFPACVYAAVGGTAVKTFRAGPRERTHSIRIDIRDASFATVTTLTRKALAAIRAGGRLREASGPVDQYDADLAVHRRLWTVQIVV